MTTAPDILCIGSVLWDVIGRSERHMRQGSDVPGRITRLPGGVALNIAMTLAQFGMRPALLSYVGEDSAGDELIAACKRLGLVTDHVYRSGHLPTDTYMAIEGSNGVIAAIADAHSLEAAGELILKPLENYALGSHFSGPIALDGNLTEELLQQIALSPIFANSDLRVAPASPEKAERLLPFLAAGRGTLYVNLEEAGILCKQTFQDAATAAKTLVGQGTERALVTDGSNAAALADPFGLLTKSPPSVKVSRLTGAGDTFMAAHIAAEFQGKDREQAFEKALLSAATYVSGGTPQ